jgi:hypothetical protein
VYNTKAKQIAYGLHTKARRRKKKTSEAWNFPSCVKKTLQAKSNKHRYFQPK